MTNKITPEYLFQEEESQTFTNQSWVAVITKTDVEPRVIFYNYYQDNLDGVDSFESFFEAAKEEANLHYDTTTSTNHITEDYGTYYASGSEVFSDYDEYSGKPCDVVKVESVILDCFKGGLTLDDLPNVINQADNRLYILDSQEGQLQQESLKEDKDPYVRYGINPNSF